MSRNLSRWINWLKKTHWISGNIIAKTIDILGHMGPYTKAEVVPDWLYILSNTP